jgi:hypothetical protein
MLLILLHLISGNILPQLQVSYHRDGIQSADPYGGTIIFKDHQGEVEDIVFRDTHTQDHYINVTAGNDKGRYFASFDYYKEDGVIIGSGYKRFSRRYQWIIQSKT